MGENTSDSIIRDVPLDEIVIYRVRDDELRVLEKGSPTSTMFSICLAAAGTAIGGFLGLLGSPIPKAGEITGRWAISVGVTIAAFVAALILGILARKTPNDVMETITKIKARDKLPSAGTLASTTSSPRGSAS